MYQPYRIWLDLAVNPNLISFKEVLNDVYANADLKFTNMNLGYKQYGDQNDLHYYGQELCVDGSQNAPFNFIVEPQIFYGKHADMSEYDGEYLYNIPAKLPELYVVVIIQFESDGKTFCYSRTYLPKVSEVKYSEAVTIVSGIKTRFNAQTDKIYKEEYIRSLEKKMEFLAE